MEATTYIGVMAESLKLVLVESGRKSLHDLLIDVLGIGHFGLGLHDSNRRAVFKLNDELAGNGLRAAGLEERSGLNDGGRNGERKNCNDGETHLDRWG